MRVHPLLSTSGVVIVLGVTACCALLPRTSQGEQTQSPEDVWYRPPGGQAKDPSMDAPLWISGMVVRAVNVAKEDLVKSVREQREQTLKYLESLDGGTLAGMPTLAFLSDGGTRDLGRCLAEVDGYDVRVATVSDRYLIYLRPVGSRCYEGGDALRGGDATYEISKGDYSILHRDLGE